MYFETMKKLFQKIPVELPKAPSHNEEHQSLLRDIGGGWCMKKLNQKLTPLNKIKLEKITRKVGWNKNKLANGKSKLE